MPGTERIIPMAEVPADPEFDPLSSDFWDNPYDQVATIHRDRPIFWAPTPGAYVVTRFEDVDAIFRDSETFEGRRGLMTSATPLSPGALTILARAEQPTTMILLDGPDHERLRSPTMRALTGRRIALMEPIIRQRVRDLLASIADRGRFEFIDSFAFPLPAYTIFDLVGIPLEDTDRLKAWSESRIRMLASRLDDEQQLADAQTQVDFNAYLREFIADKHRHPGEDFTSDLLAIHDEDPSAFTYDDIRSILLSLTVAGHETTSALLANIVLFLLDDPARWQALEASPSTADQVVNEVLRLDSSVALWRRWTTRRTVVGGVEFEKDTLLLLWIGATGRDGSVYPDPELYVPGRSRRPPVLAFGRGMHFCVGAALARLEATVALEELVASRPQLELDRSRPISYMQDVAMRRVRELWLQDPTVS